MPVQPDPTRRGTGDRREQEVAGERAPTEAELDKALADTFPASDPVSLHLESGDERRDAARTGQVPRERRTP